MPDLAVSAQCDTRHPDYWICPICERRHDKRDSMSVFDTFYTCTDEYPNDTMGGTEFAPGCGAVFTIAELEDGI